MSMSIDEIKEEIKKKNERKKEVNNLLKELKSERDTLLNDIKSLKEEKNFLELERSNNKKLIIKDELNLFEFFAIKRKYAWLNKSRFVKSNYKYCIIVNVFDKKIISKKMLKIDDSFNIDIWNYIETDTSNEIFGEGSDMKTDIKLLNNKTQYQYYPWEHEFCSRCFNNEFTFTFFIKTEEQAMLKYNNLKLNEEFLLPLVSKIDSKEFNRNYQFFYKDNKTNFDIVISMTGIVVIKGNISKDNFEELRNLNPYVFKEVS